MSVVEGGHDGDRRRQARQLGQPLGLTFGHHGDVVEAIRHLGEDPLDGGAITVDDGFQLGCRGLAASRRSRLAAVAAVGSRKPEGSTLFTTRRRDGSDRSRSAVGEEPGLDDR